jgi:signal transduction histidine kinase
MASALAMLALTYLLLQNRADATEHYVVESRLNQYASEYRRRGIEGVRQLATLRRGRAQGAFFVRVGDAQNHTVFLRHPDDWAEFHPEKLNHKTLPPDDRRTWQTLPSDDGTRLLISAERLAGGGVLQVGKANDELKELLSNYRRTTLLVFVIVLPVSFAGGAFMASRALRPVQQLTAVAQEIIDTDRLDSRVPPAASQDELDALVRVFNKMLDRIDSLVRGMRDSIDNVAHDLRTPLTRLRHKAQAAMGSEHDAVSCAGCERSTNALADCIEEADRMSTILSTIMDIAGAEAGLVKLELASVRIAKIIADVVEAYVEFAEDCAVAVHFEAPRDLHVRADAPALFRVFANLLDNAIKYTPRGGNVRITAERDEDAAKISFADTGIGISEEDLPRIWERLFRGDRSRSTHGLGLGLSFVRAIVGSHQGTLDVESQPGKGTTVRVFLNLDSSAQTENARNSNGGSKEVKTLPAQPGLQANAPGA